MDIGNAPILSTPAEHILEDTSPGILPSRLSEEQIHVQYEINRTITEIRAGKWKRIALQFPDDMLVDAPRVFELLRDGLKESRKTQARITSNDAPNFAPDVDTNDLATRLQGTTIDSSTRDTTDEDERLCILGDTSYGACCVDEVAAEHVDADVVVHYGRTCLSPTARLPVIYVFTSQPIDLDAAVASFKATYPDPDEKVCLMADIPYSHNLKPLAHSLEKAGYHQIFTPEIIHQPSSLIPNRTLPPAVQADPSLLKSYSIFHISSPPTSLLLILSSRIKSMHIFPTSSPSPSSSSPSAIPADLSPHPLLRRRYALLTSLSTAPVFGILINTLSVSNYLSALQRCQGIISRAGKKSYVFVVGKLNPAKVANFAEIGGWVVIGCWESSLVDNSRDYFRPIITPFELEVALTEDRKRVWGGEWVGGFEELLGREMPSKESGEGGGGLGNNGDGEEEEDEPPEFDLRTGRYVSQSRPMGRGLAGEKGEQMQQQPGSALVQRAKGDVATVGGQVSPAAEFLKSKRTWQGLGSDYEIAYERDEQGKIRGAAMEEGRSGVAKGYTVGEDGERS